MDNQVQTHRFGITDYIILLASQIVCLGIGVFYGRKGLTSGSVEEFALGNRKIATLPAALSIFATCYSGFGMTAMVGEMYMYGLGYMIFNIFFGIAGFFVAFAIVPVFFRIPYVSVYEYVEKRFNKRLRLTYVIIYIVQQTLYISVIMYVPAISLAVITGLPYWSTLLTFSVFCIAYSTVGGMKAVIWTDFLQSILMVCCVFSIIIKGIFDVGGFWKMWNIGIDGQRLGGLYLEESTANRYSLWAMMCGGLINGFNYLGTSQAGVQRVLSVRGPDQGRRSLIGGSSCFIIFSILTATAAVVIYANYHDCEPTLRSKETGVKTEDQIVVYYISTVLSAYPGLAGLATSGIFSGSLSSLSSYINTFATITVQDLIIPNVQNKISRKSKIILCRVLTIAYGLVCTAFALMVPHIGRATPMLTTVFGVFGGPLSGVFFLGLFSKRANTKGALVGLLTAILFVAWIAIGNKLTATPANKLPLSVAGCSLRNDTVVEEQWLVSSIFESTAFNASCNVPLANLDETNPKYVFPLYKISFAWYLPMGFSSTIVVGFLISLLFKEEQMIDDSLFSHLVFDNCTGEQRSYEGDKVNVLLLQTKDQEYFNPEKLNPALR